MSELARLTTLSSDINAVLVNKVNSLEITYELESGGSVSRKHGGGEQSSTKTAVVELKGAYLFSLSFTTRLTDAVRRALQMKRSLLDFRAGPACTPPTA
jgi:hypothetical protein